MREGAGGQDLRPHRPIAWNRDRQGGGEVGCAQGDVRPRQTVSDPEVARLKDQARKDRKLLAQAAQVLAEIDRNEGLADEHADVLTALRIRLEGKERASLEDLLTTTGDIAGKKDLGEALSSGDSGASEWPAIEEKKPDWPG